MFVNRVVQLNTSNVRNTIALQRERYVCFIFCFSVFLLCAVCYVSHSCLHFDCVWCDGHSARVRVQHEHICRARSPLSYAQYNRAHSTVEREYTTHSTGIEQQQQQQQHQQHTQHTECAEQQNRETKCRKGKCERGTSKMYNNNTNKQHRV